MTKKLSDRIWWTRQCRIQAEKRMLSNHRWTQSLLFWYSFFSVAVSIMILKFSLWDTYGDVLFVCFSVFTFGIGLFLSSSRFAERADEIKTNYTKLQVLGEKAHSFEAQSSTHTAEYEAIAQTYSELLDGIENHTAIDDAFALVDAWNRTPKPKRLKWLTRYPQCIHYWRIARSWAIDVVVRVVSFLLPVMLIIAITRWESLSG